MTDEAFGSTDLTGRWAGFYRNPITRIDNFPLVADIRQEGTRISGEMCDEITDLSDDFRKVLEVRGSEIPVLLRFQIKLVLLLYGSRSVGFSFQLPESSDLMGTVRGDRVKFTRVYRGTTFSETIVDGEGVGRQAKPGHRVHYSGRHDLEQGCISGRWSVRLRGILGLLLPPVGGSTFELYKKS